MLDGAAHFAVKLCPHSVLDESFHNPVISKDAGPYTVPFGS